LYDLVVTPDPEITGASGDSTYLPPDMVITDQLSNSDTVVHKVVYHFTPRIIPNDGESDCENGRDTTITIWVNPVPRILVSLLDSIFCDNEITDIRVKDGLGMVSGDKKYIVTALFNQDSISLISRGFNIRDTLDVGQPINDSLVNHSKRVQPVFYTFNPIIMDTRPGHEGEDCSGGAPIVVEISVNPTPDIFVGADDTILCDKTILTIELIDVLGDVEGTKVYDLDVTFTPGAVEAAGITPDGEYSDYVDISDLLINYTDSVQIITYHLTPRIKDDRPAHSGEYCDNGFDTTIVIFLNPTPRIEYLLAEDTLCYDEGFVLTTNSLVQTTHPLYYNLDISNPDLMSNVNPEPDPDSVDVTVQLDESDIVNPGFSVGTVTYVIHPYISTEQCLGSDTTITIKVNPEPVMQVTQSDTAVCYNWGYALSMNSQVLTTTGQLKYDLLTDGYNPGMVSGVPGDGFYDIVTLDQAGVMNNGDSLENVTYHFIPTILNARYSGNCAGDPKNPIIVQVAPELIGETFADTTNFGGWNITCFEQKDGKIDPNIRGGYYIRPYLYNWWNTGGSGLEPSEGAQVGLDTGTYFYQVFDVIGCEYGDSVTLLQPERMWTDTTVVSAPCESQSNKGGSIYLDPHGGTGDSLGYNYFYNWTQKPWGLELPDTSQNIVDGYAGIYKYAVEIRDMNGCLYFIDSLSISFVDAINLGINKTDYGPIYDIKCYGEKNGGAELTVTGGTPGFDLIVLNEVLDTIYNDPVDLIGGDYKESVSNLFAGEYTFIVVDDKDCLGDEIEVFEEPDSLVITWENESDTVDISCYDEGDGNIFI